MTFVANRLIFSLPPHFVPTLHRCTSPRLFTATIRRLFTYTICRLFASRIRRHDCTRLSSPRSSSPRRRFSKIVKETFELSGASNVGDFLPILRWIGVDKLEKRLKVLQEKRNSFMQDLINEHKKKTNNNNSDTISCNNKTLIDVLLSLQETDPQPYTDQIIRGLMQ
ncbi:hypothetical protein MIMGU_mgv11b022933mg, partial [Erythranthe guttata]